MTGKIRVAVVDDHPLFRAGVVYTLRSAPDLQIVAEGESPDDALHIAGELVPDVILLDVNMAGSGIEAARAIAQDHPRVKTMMLTALSDEENVMAALDAGAMGYALKGISGPELVESVRRVHRGEHYVFPTLAAKLLGHAGPARRLPPDRLAGLSRREEQILGYLVQGLSNKEIGGNLRLSEKTVKHYLTGLLDKLHVRNRVEAAVLAYSCAERPGSLAQRRQSGSRTHRIAHAEQV
jgi:DNA-binding NarL/FixJ family response regulator